MPAKPTIVKVVTVKLEEKEPPRQGEYEFVETYPPADRAEEGKK